MRVLEALAYCVGIPHTTIERVLQQEVDGLPNGTSIVLISATLTEGLRRVLVELQRRGFAVTLLGIGGLRLEQAIPGVAFRSISRHGLAELSLVKEEETHTIAAPEPGG